MYGINLFVLLIYSLYSDPNFLSNTVSSRFIRSRNIIKKITEWSDNIIRLRKANSNPIVTVNPPA